MFGRRLFLSNCSVKMVSKYVPRSTRHLLRQNLCNSHVFTIVGLFFILTILGIRFFLGHHQEPNNTHSDPNHEHHEHHHHRHPENPFDVHPKAKPSAEIPKPAASAAAPDYHANDNIQHLFATPAIYQPSQLKAWHQPLPIKPLDPNAPGEMGRPVTFTDDEKPEVERRFKENQFNIIASDRVSLNRTVPDLRPAGCVPTASAPLPDTSIIIVFHNEAWSTLLRTLWSIRTRSPPELVREIILVDDASERDHLGQRLADEVARLPFTVRLLRQLPRQGLIKARLAGAAVAVGQVLTFLDAHVECAEGWLPLLLERVALNRYTVPSPVIDLISDDDFSIHSAAESLYGGMSSSFEFKWIEVPERERQRVRPQSVEPLRQPIMAGGLFSIDRAFFYEIGSYDEGMEIWGAENVEMSLRTWMCGGRLELVPCSRVSHVFRKTTPYTFPKGAGQTISYNKVRLVKVWADQHEELFFKLNARGRMARDNYGDISGRVQLRKDLHCKSLDWYLENIYPEHDLPVNSTLGSLQNKAFSNMCLDSMAGESVSMYACHNMGGNQLWAMRDDGHIQCDGMCITADEFSPKIAQQKCEKYNVNQIWMYDPSTQIIQLRANGQCLSYMDNSGKDKVPVLIDCMINGDGSDGQKWQIVDEPEWDVEAMLKAVQL